MPCAHVYFGEVSLHTEKVDLNVHTMFSKSSVKQFKGITDISYFYLIVRKYEANPAQT